MNIKFSRILPVLLCLLLLCSCAGGKSSEKTVSSLPESPVETSIPYRMLYCSTDSINPFKAVTQVNQELALLLFDPLIKLNNRFEPVYCVASSVKAEGGSYTVTLKSVNFTDGTPLTAGDVVFSANSAKASSRFSQQLANMAACTAVDSHTVRFVLNSPDPGFAGLLDFPIIKQGSDTLVNMDNIALPPIGCGRYVFDGDAKTLTANESYYGGAPNFRSIRLLDAPDSGSVSQRIRSGEVLVYYSDLGNNKVPNMNGKAANVPLNNLVYLGCNMSSSLLKSVYARQAISCAINRTAIAKTAFFGNATAALGPFPSCWKPAKSSQNILPGANADIAVENFKQLGYNKGDDGYYAISGGKHLALSLLVNADNLSRKSAADMIASQLNAAGIEVTVNALSYGAYIAALNERRFDLYLAEVRILGNMDISPLVTPGGACAYGVVYSSPAVAETPAEETADGTPATPQEDVAPDLPSYELSVTTAQAVSKYKSGEYSIDDMITVFNTELPVIPVCHRTGILIYNEKITTEPTPSVSDIHFNIEKYTIK